MCASPGGRQTPVLWAPGSSHRPLLARSVPGGGRRLLGPACGAASPADLSGPRRGSPNQSRIEKSGKTSRHSLFSRDPRGVGVQAGPGEPSAEHRVAVLARVCRGNICTACRVGAQAATAHTLLEPPAPAFSGA